MKPHAFHPEAAEEYANAAKYYSSIDSELGRFYDELEHLIHDICTDPERFRFLIRQRAAIFPRYFRMRWFMSSKLIASGFSL